MRGPRVASAPDSAKLYVEVHMTRAEIPRLKVAAAERAQGQRPGRVARGPGDRAPDAAHAPPYSAPPAAIGASGFPASEMTSPKATPSRRKTALGGAELGEQGEGQKHEAPETSGFRALRFGSGGPLRAA